MLSSIGHWGTMHDRYDEAGVGIDHVPVFPPNTGEVPP